MVVMGNAVESIVVVEDDNDIADLLDMYLRQGGFKVVLAPDGESGLAAVQRHSPAMVVLDVGLPGAMDGFDVLRELRRGGSTPVMMLTAREDEIDRILGLELGADDYVLKPFSPREVVARVKAILRRVSGPTEDSPPVIELGPIRVDVGRREVTLHDEVIHLAAREFDLLAHLAQNQGLALSRRQLLTAVWGPEWYGDERTVDVHVRQLRRKLGEDLPLATVWRVGYRLG